MTFTYSIRDIFEGSIHSSRYSCLEDAISAAKELAYDMEMDESEFEVVGLHERVISSLRISA